MVDNVDGEQLQQPGVVTPAPGPEAGAATPERTGLGISVAQALIAVGAVAIIVSLFLNWLDLHVSVGAASLSRTGNATKVPVQFLFDRHETANDPTILVVLIPAAALGLLGAVIHQWVLAFIAAAASLFVAAMYVYQADQSLGDLNKSAQGVVHLGLNDLIGIAPYVCGLGALIMLVGAFMLGRGPRRADVPRDR